jgi:hypothetical protein
METKLYAGIGSRNTPSHILGQMSEIATHLGSLNWVLRSGHADGADLAFENGAKEDTAEIWLPWFTFNKSLPKYKYHIHRVISQDDTEAYDSVKKYHPNPNRLSFGAVSLMARNYRQIIGLKSQNSSFVICWTSDGKDSGGTGQAIRIARDNNIPVYNLFNKGIYEKCINIDF